MNNGILNDIPEKVYINHRDFYDYVCEVNFSTGDYEELERKRLNIKMEDTWPGSYIKEDNNFIGYISSKDGGFLFYNRKKYELSSKNEWKVNVKKGKKLMNFLFTGKES